MVRDIFCGTSKNELPIIGGKIGDGLSLGLPHRGLLTPRIDAWISPRHPTIIGGVSASGFILVNDHRDLSIIELSLWIVVNFDYDDDDDDDDDS